MVLVRGQAHPRGLGLAAQRKVFCLRKTITKTGKVLSWRKIAVQVKNLIGEIPGWKVQQGFATLDDVGKDGM